MPLLDGITARRVPTSRLTVNVLERAGESGTGACKSAYAADTFSVKRGCWYSYAPWVAGQE